MCKTALGDPNPRIAAIARYDLGVMELNQRRLEEAAEHLRWATMSPSVDIAPLAADALGECLYRRGDMEGATFSMMRCAFSGHPKARVAVDRLGKYAEAGGNAALANDLRAWAGRNLG